MDDQTLTRHDIGRIQRAASYAGFDWQLICTRPKVALLFCERIESEMQRSGIPVERQPQTPKRPVVTPVGRDFYGVA